MSDLVNLQNQFQRNLMQRKFGLDQLIISTPTVSAQTRFAIYAHAYQARLMDALISHYPVLYALLGTEAFATLANDYIVQFPSTYRSIRWFGADLPEFIRHHAHVVHFPYSPELAQFEWTLTLVFDAADCSPLSMEKVAQIPPEQWPALSLAAHPSLHRLDLCYNIPQLWQAVTEGKTPPAVIQQPQATHWVLWRHHLINRYCSLTHDEAWAIDAVLKKLSFGEIGEGLCQWTTENEAGVHLASLLKQWIQSGMLADTTE